MNEEANKNTDTFAYYELSKHDFKTEVAHGASFMIRDISSYLLLYNDTAKIVNIYKHVGPEREQVAKIREVLDKYKNNNVVICTDAYISCEEFPVSEWCLEVRDAEPGKKLLPVKEVVKRESKILESLGFVDVNWYVGYEYKRAFIYPNEAGKKVIEYWKSHPLNVKQ